MARVLVIARNMAEPLPSEETWPFYSANVDWPMQWVPRELAETDEKYLQIIPYALIRDATRALWCYERIGGDPRVLNRRSCGVGGHVDETDSQTGFLSTVRAALGRELHEELGWKPDLTGVYPVAWLYEGLSAIGRVHLGLIFVLTWDKGFAPCPVAGEPLAPMGFCPAEIIAADDRFELWSRLAAGWAMSHP